MKRKKVFYVAGLVLLAALLVGTGLFQLRGVYAGYRENMLIYESRHLNSVVSSSGRGLMWMLQGYRGRLAALVRDEQFRRAEAMYEDLGLADGLAAVLSRRNDLLGERGYSTAVFDGDRLLVSTEGYPVERSEDELLDEGIALCTGPENEIWFVFSSATESGLTCEVAVSLQSVFTEAASSVHVGRYGWLFLLDDQLELFYGAQNGQIRVERPDRLAELDPGVDMAAMAELAARGEEPPESYCVYDYPWEGTGDVETLVVTFPQTLGSRTFVMGAAVSFREFDSMLSDAFVQVIVVALMILGGFLALLLLAALLFVAYKRNVLELDVLRERAEVMEELNREQQSLAHSERLQQLGLMSSGIAHEFNNLLTPIMGQSVLLLEELADQADSPQFENALDIYEAAEKARDILKRMASMSRKGEDRPFAPVELGALLRRTINMASLAKGPHIRVVLQGGEGVYVLGSEQLLTQMFLNICLNAFQAMESEGTLTIRAAKEAAEEPVYARIDLEDTGPGIPEALLPSLYDPFFTTKGESGTGLGLAICQRIVANHRGSIAAANRPEGGAVFTVCLPLTDAPDGENE